MNQNLCSMSFNQTGASVPPDRVLSALHPSSGYEQGTSRSRKEPNYWTKQLQQAQMPMNGDHIRNNQSFGGTANQSNSDLQKSSHHAL